MHRKAGAADCRKCRFPFRFRVRLFDVLRGKSELHPGCVARCAALIQRVGARLNWDGLQRGKIEPRGMEH